VTWEDQANINNFGRLNTRLTELREEVKGKKVRRQPVFNAAATSETSLR